MYYKALLILLVWQSVLAAQPLREALAALEQGDTTTVREMMLSGNLKHTEQSFLEALLEDNAEKAVNTYLTIIQAEKQFPYRDLLLLRVYSYYYSAGSYKSAEKYALQLAGEYPQSPYIKILAKDFQDYDRDEDLACTEKKDSPQFTHTLQVGVFSQRENAETFGKQVYQQHSLECFFGKRTIGGSEFVVVYAGKFISYNQAQTKRNELLSSIPGIKSVPIP